MAANIQVASLTAPITVTIPTEKLVKFQQQLLEIANALEFIARQFQDMEKKINKTFGKTNKHLKISNTQINKFVGGQKKSNKETDKSNNKAKRLGKVWGSWFDMMAKVRVGLGLVQFAMDKLLQTMIIPAGFFAGFTFMAERLNATTTEMSRLSEATGFALNDIRALGLEAKSFGFTFEHVSSLVEELNNKLGGEAGGFVENNLREGIEALGVSVEELQKLKPDEQLEKIMNAGKMLAATGNTNDLQKLASAYDKIFGQEGNRLLGGFTQRMVKLGVDFEGFKDQARGFVEIFPESERGARSFTESINKVIGSVTTLYRNFFGTFGDTVQPFFDGILPVFANLSSSMKGLSNEVGGVLADAFTKTISMFVSFMDWLKDNQTLVVSFISDTVELFQSMFRIGVNVGKSLAPLSAALLIIIKLAARALEFLSWIASTKFGQVVTSIVVVTAAVYGAIKALGIATTVMKFFGITSTVATTAATTGILATGKAALIAAAPFVAWAAAVAGLLLLFSQLADQGESLRKLFSNPMKFLSEGFGGIGDQFAEDARGVSLDHKLEQLKFNKQKRIDRELRDTPSNSTANSTTNNSRSDTTHIINNVEVNDQSAVETLLGNMRINIS